MMDETNTFGDRLAFGERVTRPARLTRHGASGPEALQHQPGQAQQEPQHQSGMHPS